jgi:hypothetical protein
MAKDSDRERRCVWMGLRRDTDEAVRSLSIRSIRPSAHIQSPVRRRCWVCGRPADLAVALDAVEVVALCREHAGGLAQMLSQATKEKE